MKKKEMSQMFALTVLSDTVNTTSYISSTLWQRVRQGAVIECPIFIVVAIMRAAGGSCKLSVL